MPAARASCSLSCRPCVKIGVRSSRPSDDAGVAGGDRPAAVDPLGRAARQRPLGQRRQRETKAGADRELRQDRPVCARVRGPAERRQAARDQDHARGRSQPERHDPAPEARRRDRRERHDRQGEAGGQRVEAQPLISRIARRNSAPTSPPETRNRAAFAPRCGRSAGSGHGAHSHTHDREERPSGERRLHAKIDSQPSSCVKIPPTAGPTRGARRHPLAPRPALPPPSAPVAWVSRSSAAQTTAAPATPWAARPPTRTPKEGASPHRSDAAAKPGCRQRRPAPGGGARATAAGKAETASARLNGREHPGQRRDLDLETARGRRAGRSSPPTSRPGRCRPRRTRSAMRCVRRALRRRTGSVYDVRSKAFFSARAAITSARWVRYSPDA